ncbi:hypothetical protein CCHL11_06888 [Colletotrichum chlorophyti]|uniref:Uncharacterized protein n=1 Tax=Colletotrichum chlorophyti TaxID=708187 RepID=A0A1Q8RBJ5_9PEZI|nr:hypothetical protein CCHL11_06888 [Colletotrichum chlorophyti]
MKGRPVDQLVYEHMFPKPRASDPQNFHALLQRSLILEVRQEVHSFYGHLDTQEAKYPGLDYCNPIHRIRLSRWTWHRRLFRTFDNLRLTPNEIASLTKWEGTKWAKERYEKEQGIIIRDTAGDGFPDWVEPEDRPAPPARSSRSRSAETDDATDPADEDMEGEESDEELESVGVALNQRLRERAARREAGDMNTVLDEEWEQWLKNVIENGELPFITNEISQSSVDAAVVPQALFPPRMLGAARAGQWQDIPDFLHDIIRRSLRPQNPSSSEENTTAAPGDVRVPPRDVSNVSAAAREVSEPENPSRYPDLIISTARDYAEYLAGEHATRPPHSYPLEMHQAMEIFSRLTLNISPTSATVLTQQTLDDATEDEPEDDGSAALDTIPTSVPAALWRRYLTDAFEQVRAIAQDRATEQEDTAQGDHEEYDGSLAHGIILSRRNSMRSHIRNWGTHQTMEEDGSLTPITG